MEFKTLPEEERVLFKEDALKDLPPFESKDGKADPIEEVGDCFEQRIQYVTAEEYRTFLERISSAGWETMIVRTEPINGIVYSSIYRKDGLLLSIVYFDFPADNPYGLRPKLYWTVGLEPEYRTFQAGDLFDDVPIPAVGEARETGEGNFTKTIPCALRADYEKLLSALITAGWEKRYDNGAGLGNALFTAHFTRDRRTLSVVFAAPSRKIFVTVGRDQAPLSPFLFGDPSVQKSILPGQKTSLHMLELWHFGNSFVIRLKNGHFLVSDGGLRYETPYLLDYLETLVPAGEKPVIEAWLISHMHADHCGVLIEMGLNESWGDRIVVEGVYISVPSRLMMTLDPGAPGIERLIHRFSKYVRNSAGEPVPFYRLRTGERYGFSDITMDVLLAQELLPYEDCTGDLNDTTTWLLFTIEGQKVFIAGDGDKGGMRILMDNYTPEFMRMDVMSLLHHGYNTRDWFTDYCKAKTVLFTCAGSGPSQKKAQNEYLKTKVDEWLPWGDGTKVLTFPYRVGESQTLPHFDWKYNQGETRPGMPLGY